MGLNEKCGNEKSTIKDSKSDNRSKKVCIGENIVVNNSTLEMVDDTVALIRSNNKRKLW